METMVYEIQMLIESMWIQFKQIGLYWAIGLIMGSFISVYLSNSITEKMISLKSHGIAFPMILLASCLGIVSPLCMYGTVPLIAALGHKGVPQHILVAFMISSILLNPNLLMVSFALGAYLAVARLIFSILLGVFSGVLTWFFFRNKELFLFHRFVPHEIKKKKSFFPDLIKAFRITSPYLLFGIVLTSLCDRYIPSEWISGLFGSRYGLGVLFATILSVPLYACGGGTIPLINMWMQAGMGAGDALAFMLAGPATKINNLSAVKMILGIKHFCFYLIYCLLLAFMSGIVLEKILILRR